MTSTAVDRPSAFSLARIWIVLTTNIATCSIASNYIVVKFYMWSREHHAQLPGGQLDLGDALHQAGLLEADEGQHWLPQLVQFPDHDVAHLRTLGNLLHEGAVRLKRDTKLYMDYFETHVRRFVSCNQMSEPYMRNLKRILENIVLYSIHQYWYTGSHGRIKPLYIVLDKHYSLRLKQFHT